MDKFGVSNGVARSGLLFVGLVGLYACQKKALHRSMFYVSCYITGIGLFALAQYLIEGDYKESKDKDKDGRKPGIQKYPASAKKSVTGVKISSEEFAKEADKLLIEINNTTSSNVPRKIKLPNIDADPEAIANAGLEKFLEMGQAQLEDITLRTSPIKMEVLDIKYQNLDNTGMSSADTASDVIDQIIRLRQIERDAERAKSVTAKPI